MPSAGGYVILIFVPESKLPVAEREMSLSDPLQNIIS